MGDTEASYNTLHKTKHPSCSTPTYRVGLDPATTSFLVGCIERALDIPGQIISNYITHNKKEPSSETLV